MAFSSWAEFIAMGGHGVYVWFSYALATAVIAFMFIEPIVNKHNFIKQQRSQLRRQARETEK